MKADDYDLSDFGIIERGTFDGRGYPVNWALSGQQIAAHFPLWMHEQPVMCLKDNVGPSVYLRGLYSEELSRERSMAMYIKEES